MHGASSTIFLSYNIHDINSYTENIQVPSPFRNLFSTGCLYEHSLQCWGYGDYVTDRDKTDTNGWIKWWR